MPRPAKKRRICQIPKERSFACSTCQKKESIALSLDEYESIRLIDYQGLSQEEAAMLMGVARTTIQAIYQEARIKLSQMLIEGRHLEITGGQIEVEEGRKDCILIPVEEEDLHGNISESLGRAKYYLLYNLASQKAEWIANPSEGQKNGKGIQAAKAMVNSQARILISTHCGEKAGKVLDAAGFQIYEAKYQSIEENIQAFQRGELPLLTTREHKKA